MGLEDERETLDWYLREGMQVDLPGQRRKCLSCLHCDICRCECRRHPPKPCEEVDYDGKTCIEPEFPQTELNFWCGEWSLNPSWEDDAKARIRWLDEMLEKAER